MRGSHRILEKLVSIDAALRVASVDTISSGEKTGEPLVEGSGSGAHTERGQSLRQQVAISLQIWNLLFFYRAMTIGKEHFLACSTFWVTHMSSNLFSSFKSGGSGMHLVYR